MTGRVPNPYVLSRDGWSAMLPARVCRVLEVELGVELARLRVRALGVDPEVSAALTAIRESAMSFVPPEEHGHDESPEQVPLSEWMSTTEASELLRVKPRAVTQAIARGGLPAQRVGPVWRIRRRDVETYREERSA